MPARIDDLRVVVDPGKRHLTWSIPIVNVDKSRPVDLKSFKLLVKKLPVGEDGCRFCDEGFSEYLTISYVKPAFGYVLGSSFYLPLPVVPDDYLFVYSVLSLNSRGWASESSNKLVVFSLPNVAPPSKLLLHPSASVIDMEWQVPVLPPHFKGVLRYRVYRRDAERADHAWKLITPEPVVASEYIDVGLSDWSSYFYAVTSLITEDGTSYESPLSNEVQVIPGDYSPPEMLTEFSAFNYQGGVQLLWSPSFVADLAGYRIYRRDSVTGVDQLVVVLPPDKHEFFDSSIIYGRTYHYRVTAYDRSDRKNESESTPEVPVTVQ